MLCPAATQRVLNLLGYRRNKDSRACDTYGYINTLKVWFLWLYTLFFKGLFLINVPIHLLYNIYTILISEYVLKRVWTSSFVQFVIGFNLHINNILYILVSLKVQFGGICGRIQVHLNSKYRWWKILFQESVFVSSLFVLTRSTSDFRLLCFS